ncbi:OmpP1/FadL family transporter [Winogradskyella thalassocola]|uniref:Outer membrane protein transport protein (OMPP1/FadL/TodX) n=1 Tax=Winogradskyella thalassocola TaxID=262004 RepID=A0A1G8GR52_9FLAO|nr:outer membrane protein transport protein [Winogradskyella thalassocola]SDH96846.1 Outer membrane protein transport protein (OMPP1/FadL/TodX) [Winogradskyella thalassocola]
MKKLLMLSIGLISTSYILAQDITDALRYSMDEIQGTARYRAMSGAFGALGGDMSSVNINPAGSAIFNNSHASISLGLFNTNNDISYFDSTNSSSNSNIDLNQLGAAFIFKNTNTSSGWNKFSLSFAYDRSADFDNDWVASGVNENNTIGDFFLSNAQGLRLDEISALPGESLSEAYSEIGSFYGYRNQQAFLGYEGYIIEPLDNADENIEYDTNIKGGNYKQRYAYASRGYNGKLAFNIATSYKDKFYFGLNLNSHFINYERTTYLNESNSNASSIIKDVDFENNLLTTGSGFSFQLGGIAKITEELRVGLSYSSPTWYRISDETSQYLATSRLEGGSNINQIVNPNVVNIYEEYKLQTPGKITGSLAYVFGRKGLLSFDYAVKDYSNSKFKPTTDALFSSLNNSISNDLDSAVSYRLGGEYRFKQVSFRGGYRFEESPYKNDNFYGNLNGYSLGLGYNFGDITLDFAFSQSQRDYDYQLYSEGLTDAAQFQSKYTDLILTLAFNI